MVVVIHVAAQRVGSGGSGHGPRPVVGIGSSVGLAWSGWLGRVVGIGVGRSGGAVGPPGRGSEVAQRMLIGHYVEPSRSVLVQHRWSYIQTGIVRHGTQGGGGEPSQATGQALLRGG